MKSPLKKIFRIMAVVLLLLIVLAGWYVYKALPIGTGFAAKYICSSTFISKRNPDVVMKEEVTPINPLFKIINVSVNKEKKYVVGSSFGLVESIAYYREGCGCTLAIGISGDDLHKQIISTPPPASKRRTDMPWPDGTMGPEKFLTRINSDLLRKAVDDAFSEPGPGNPMNWRLVETGSSSYRGTTSGMLL